MERETAEIEKERKEKKYTLVLHHPRGIYRIIEQAAHQNISNYILSWW